MRASFLLLAALGAAPIVPKAVPNTLPDGPVLVGAGADALARETRRQCPGVPTDRLTPADLLDAEETFRDGLSAAQRQAMDRQLPQDGASGPARCAHSAGGASCPAAAYLEEIAGAGLMPRFVAGLCAPGAVR
ncbi:hypothetical protein [Xanthomonas sp. LMG 12462]|uniref:hypothetical protein n=1 Tax=Xanthomonas sp. LMG 12462 TaxID=1591134 RepID=UPI001265A0CF|nr:hypothetical protein [Xanthomonas sp. LMG 12462]KAB7764961.1 hypothetical protein CEK69_17920 [Xanthomonas sp. LMG 12462]